MKKWIACLLIIMAVLAVAGCGQNEEKKEALVVGTMPDVDSIPFIIAQEKGYFADEKVNVVLKPFKSAMDRDSALQSGQLDGTISDMLAVAFAKAGGFEVRMTSLTSGSYKLITSPETTVESITDLKGKDIAVSKNTVIEYVTDRIAEQSQLKEMDLHKVVIPQIPTRLEMLQNGQLAAATLPEPMASIALKNGAHFMHSSDQLGIRPGVMMFTGQAIGEKQAQIAAMYRAYNRAVQYLREQPQEAYMDLLVEKGGFPPSVQGALHLPEYEQAKLPDRADLAACMEWMQAKNLIPTAYAYEDLVSGAFAEQ